MSEDLDEIGVSWRPDGVGLDDHSRALVAEHGGRIHLRLSPSTGRYPVAACHGGLGDWWTGVGREVNCPDCLEWVHG